MESCSPEGWYDCTLIFKRAHFTVKVMKDRKDGEPSHVGGDGGDVITKDNVDIGLNPRAEKAFLLFPGFPVYLFPVDRQEIQVKSGVQ